MNNPLQSTDFSSLDSYYIYLGEMCLNTELTSKDFSSLDNYYIYLGAINSCLNPPSSGGDIVIPTPQVKINPKTAEIQVFYLPIGGTGATAQKWASLNPKLYLFRYRNARRKTAKDVNGNPYPKKSLGGFYHPTHLDGINFPNGHVYSGTTFSPPNYFNGTNGRQLTTEFNMLVAGQYRPYIHIPVNLNPYDWAKKIKGGTWQFMNEDGSDFGDTVDKYKITGKKTAGKYKSRRSHIPNNPKVGTFCFAIGCENPDTNTNIANPIIFGHFSEQFRLRFNLSLDYSKPAPYTVVTGFHWDIETSSSPKKR